MRLQEFINEAITMRRLDTSSKAQSTMPEEDPDNLDDMDYMYPDEEPDFDFGDAVAPGDDELDIDFDNNTGDESGRLGQELEQPLDSHGSTDRFGMSSSSASTPSGQALEKDLSDAGQAVDGEDPMNQLASTATEDPNKQGVLRKVEGVRLVYKRQTENGSYEELWAYNISKSNAPDSFKKRRAILAGTDIPPNKSTSPDGSQTYDIWTTTNAELIRVKGLQN